MRAYLIDIDGTVVDRGQLIGGASEAIASLRVRGLPFRFATNITRKPRRMIAEELTTLGVTCAPDEILTATSAAAAWLRSRGVNRIELLLPHAAREEFEGFEIGVTNPQCVVVGDLADEWTFATLNRAFRFLMNGAELLAVQKNRYWNAEDGLTLDCGPYVTALEYASGQVATIAGKPSSAFFESAARSLGVLKSEITMIGDDLDSDVIGARVAGLRSVLVRTGKYRNSDEAKAAGNADGVVDSLEDALS